MNEKPTLLPCPFCGNSAILTRYSGADTIFCEGVPNTCHALMGGEESTATADQLIAAWNRRATSLCAPSVEPVGWLSGGDFTTDPHEADGWSLEVAAGTRAQVTPLYASPSAPQPAEGAIAHLCGYCGANMIPGSECRTSASAGACSLYQSRAATVQLPPSAAPQPAEGWKLLKDTTYDERSWPEDFAHENGNYWNTCCHCQRQFTGHKRRVTCRACASAAPQPVAVEPLTDAARVLAEFAKTAPGRLPSRVQDALAVVAASSPQEKDGTPNDQQEDGRG
jgi:hypothetical protein